MGYLLPVEARVLAIAVQQTSSATDLFKTHCRIGGSKIHGQGVLVQKQIPSLALLGLTHIYVGDSPSTRLLEALKPHGFEQADGYGAAAVQNNWVRLRPWGKFYNEDRENPTCQSLHATLDGGFRLLCEEHWTQPRIGHVKFLMTLNQPLLPDTEITAAYTLYQVADL